MGGKQPMHQHEPSCFPFFLWRQAKLTDTQSHSSDSCHQHLDSESEQLLAMQMKKPATKWCGLSCMWPAGRQMRDEVKNTDLLPKLAEAQGFEAMSKRLICMDILF